MVLWSVLLLCYTRKIETFMTSYMTLTFEYLESPKILDIHPKC